MTKWDDKAEIFEIGELKNPALFFVIDDEEILKFDKNAVYYRGRKLTLDNEIAEGLKEWVTGMDQRYAETIIQNRRYEQEIMQKNAEIRALKERLGEE